MVVTAVLSYETPEDFIQWDNIRFAMDVVFVYNCYRDSNDSATLLQRDAILNPANTTNVVVPISFCLKSVAMLRKANGMPCKYCKSVLFFARGWRNEQATCNHKKYS